MNEFLTQESPAKVLALLSACVTSLFLLFAVTLTNSSFNQVYNPMPDPFNPVKVMAILDQGSNSYSQFMAANLINPAKDQMAFLQDNVQYIADNAGPQLSAAFGLNHAAAAPQPQVAGDSTQVVASALYPPHSGGVFSIFFGN